MSTNKVILAVIKDMVTNSLRILKDENFQRRVWFGEGSPEVSSYLDTIVHFLDRSEFIFDQASSDEYLGEDNYLMLKQLHDLVQDHVELVEDCMDPDLMEEDQLLNDPNWHDIQTLAEKLEVALKDFLREHSHD